MKNRGMMMVAVIIFSSMCVCSASAKTIGLAWEGQSGMAKRVLEGFQMGMKEFAPGVKIEMKRELASIDDLAGLVSKWNTEKDAMVILRSSGAELLGKNPPAIPAFIGACNHPGLLGAVKNLASPEGNITGVTYYLPFSTQFEIFQAIIPKMTSVLLLLEKDHPSTAIDQDGTRAVCSKLGIKYNEKICSNVQDIVNACRQYRQKVSVIIIGNQALVIDNAAKVIESSDKTPVFAYSSKPVKVGALGGFVADDVKLGYMLSQSVADVLIKGKSIKNVPVKVDPDPKFFINVTTAEKLKLEIPYTILETATLIE